MPCYDDEREENDRETKRLQKMTVPQLQEELDKRMKKALIAAIKDLPETIEEQVERAGWHIITAAMGVKRDHWSNDKWEIDGSNGKGTALAVKLGEEALKQVQLAMPDFVMQLVLADGAIPLPKIAQAMRKEYKERVYNTLHEEAGKWVEENAAKRAAELLTKLTGDEKFIKELAGQKEEEDDDEE